MQVHHVHMCPVPIPYALVQCPYVSSTCPIPTSYAMDTMSIPTPYCAYTTHAMSIPVPIAPHTYLIPIHEPGALSSHTHSPVCDMYVTYRLHMSCTRCVRVVHATVCVIYMSYSSCSPVVHVSHQSHPLWFAPQRRSSHPTVQPQHQEGMRPKKPFEWPSWQCIVSTMKGKYSRG